MRKLPNVVPALLLTVSLLAGCGSQAAETTASVPSTEIATAQAVTETSVPETTMETNLPEDSLSPAEEILETMTLRQKVGQLFIIRPDALDQSQTLSQIDNNKEPGVTAVTDDFSAMLEQYPVGGFILFGKNIVSETQIIQFNEELQNSSALPLFLAVDEEGGTVARLANHKAFRLTKYKSAADVGSSKSPSDALEMGITIGTYLAKYGFNLNFAPVADVNTNPKNTVIGNRAFSTDAKIAAQTVKLVSEGLNSRGIIATFKHFPGHGDTAEDSHIQLAITKRTLDQLSECEFLPFLRADSDDLVMVGHIAAPEITGDLVPASMSGEMIRLLKEHLGFDGLVITDSLTMNAIMNSYSSGEAAVTALQAGCDILLMPRDLTESFDAVLSALEEGTLTHQWLDETVLRILEFKMQHNILKY